MPEQRDEHDPRERAAVSIPFAPGARGQLVGAGSRYGLELGTSAAIVKVAEGADDRGSDVARPARRTSA